MISAGMSRSKRSKDPIRWSLLADTYPRCGLFLFDLAEELIRSCDNGHDGPQGVGVCGRHGDPTHFDGVMLPITVVDKGIATVGLTPALPIFPYHPRLSLAKVGMGTVLQRPRILWIESAPLWMVWWKVFSRGPRRKR